MVADIIAGGQHTVKVTLDSLFRVGFLRTEDDVNTVLPEKFDSAGAHTAGDDHVGTLLGKPDGQEAGLVLGRRDALPVNDCFSGRVDIEEVESFTMTEMGRQHAARYGYSVFHSIPSIIY
jgi:hypothetical protein